VFGGVVPFDGMSLTESIGVPEGAQREEEPSGRRWLTALAAFGTAGVLFLFSLYAPPAIRRALGKESDES